MMQVLMLMLIEANGNYFINYCKNKNTKMNGFETEN